jgi:hypothetical protein
MGLYQPVGSGHEFRNPAIPTMLMLGLRFAQPSLRELFTSHLNRAISDVSFGFGLRAPKATNGLCSRGKIGWIVFGH